MPLDTMLRTIRAETVAGRLRANDLAEAVTFLLGEGRDSSQAERELFDALDRLTFLRMRQHAIEVMRGFAFTTAEA